MGINVQAQGNVLSGQIILILTPGHNLHSLNTGAKMWLRKNQSKGLSDKGG